MFPYPGREETGIVVGASAAFQGWDLLTDFIMSSAVAGEDVTTSYKVGAVNSMADAVGSAVLLADYQATLLFRRGHITQASPRFVVVRDKTYSQTNITGMSMAEYNASSRTLAVSGT